MTVRVGYARRSTREQGTSLVTQREALMADGCERVYEDTISGAKSKRPGLDAALDYVRAGGGPPRRDSSGSAGAYTR